MRQLQGARENDYVFATDDPLAYQEFLVAQCDRHRCWRKENKRSNRGAYHNNRGNVPSTMSSRYGVKVKFSDKALAGEAIITAVEV